MQRTLTRLRSLLRTRAGQVDLHPCGSWVHGTAQPLGATPEPELDVICVMRDARRPATSTGELLEALAASLPEARRVASRRGAPVALRLDGFPARLIPALPDPQEEDGALLVGTTHDSPLIRTRLGFLSRFLSTLDLENPHRRPLVRVLKAWRDVLDVPMSSTAIELIAADQVGKAASNAQLTELLRGCLTLLAAPDVPIMTFGASRGQLNLDGQAPLHLGDPGTLDNNVLAWMTQEDWEQVNQAARASRRLLGELEVRLALLTDESEPEAPA